MAGILDSVNQRTQLVGQNRLELLLFRLDSSQLYGINVFKVKEVLQCPKLTIMPKSSPVVRGVANIRGGTIPILDLSMATGRQVGVETKLTVGVDKGMATSAIKKFVESYNKLISTTNQLTSVVSAGEGKPPVVGGLVGDSSVRSVLSGLRAELVSPQSGGDINVLADLGITTQKDGTLKIDDSKLNTAIGDNFTAVSSFLTGSDGLMSRLTARVDGYTKSGGVLQQRMDGLQGTLRSVEKQKSALELRMTQVQDRLYAQFQAMDSLVSQLNKTSERLTQALGSLPGVVKKNS